MPFQICRDDAEPAKPKKRISKIMSIGGKLLYAELLLYPLLKIICRIATMKALEEALLKAKTDISSASLN